MGIPMNMNGVDPQQGGGPLPNGDYIVKIVDAVEIEGRTNKTPGIECTMEVLVGDHAERRVWDTIWVTPKTLGMVRWRLECAGVPIPDGEFELEGRHLMGRRVLVTVRQEAYTGRDGEQKTKAAVKGWKPAPAAAPDDPFVNAASVDPGSTPPPHTDDDIPF
jgi:hypothetical protein